MKLPDDVRIAILHLLRWFDANAGGAWPSEDLWDTWQQWRELICDWDGRCLLNQTGTMENAPGLSAHGRLVLAELESERKKIGAPSKDETPSEMKIIGALKVMLQKRERDEPPTGRQIVEVSGVSNVSRFIRKHFKSQQEFEAAWRREDVAKKLAAMEYIPERCAPLRDDD